MARLHSNRKPVGESSRCHKSTQRLSAWVETYGSLELKSLSGCPPISPFSEHWPLNPKATADTNHPSKSGSGNQGREEVKLASIRGCKVASHAHCTGWHQEIKLPRHGLQQRSTTGKAGGRGGQTGLCNQGGWGQHRRKHGKELPRFMWVGR